MPLQKHYVFFGIFAYKSSLPTCRANYFRGANPKISLASAGVATSLLSNLAI